MLYIEEIQKVAKDLGGYVIDDGLSIRIDTGDRTSKENFDGLMYEVVRIREHLDKYRIKDYWADHDTQIIEFEECGGSNA